MGRDERADGDSVVHGTSSSSDRRILYELDGVADVTLAGLENGTIQRDLAGEVAEDLAKNGGILLLRVEVVCGHDAPAAQVVNLDESGAGAKLPPFPFALRETVDAADDDVGTQPPAVFTER